MTKAEVERELRQSKDEWEHKVYLLILEIPSGHVITYGGLARRANALHDLNIVPRNVANLRRKLYGWLTHDTDVPLHRIATQGDAQSKFDQPLTQQYNERLRTAEGSWPQPQWLTD